MSLIRQSIPNLLTTANLVGGIFAIVLTLEGQIDLASYCILISLLCDFLDGFTARLLKVESALGKQLDSLADLVTFGVAPGVMIYYMLDPYFFNFFIADAQINSEFLEPSSSNPLVHYKASCKYAKYITVLMPVFAMFRLAKFNIDESQTFEFKGLPTPAAAMFFVSFPLIAWSVNSESKLEMEAVEFLFNPYTLTVCTLVIPTLMLLPIRIFALKFKSYGWKGNEIRYIFLTISAILLATLFWWGIPIIIMTYVLMSMINNLVSRKDAKAQRND